MKKLTTFFGAFALCLMPCAISLAATAPINSPAGAIMGGGSSNLTSFTGSMGSLNNNAWNSMTTGRSAYENTGTTGAAAAPADFGNCNAVISRCATPKCTGGGCVDANIAATIVRGCVQSNSACTQYGDDLVNYMVGQLVAASTAVQNQMQAAAAAGAAAQQSSDDQTAALMQQMQQQMQQMQQQMADAQAASDKKIADALATQAATQAAATPTAAGATTTLAAGGQTPPVQGDNGLTTAQTTAAANGVPVDVLIRQQAAGDIQAKLDDVSAQMDTLKAAMQTTFDYAGCDQNGTNCTGVKRTAAFKDKANKFFDPYNDVLQTLYDALTQAQTLGVDISDIYMMLNNSCNQWATFLCPAGAGEMWINKRPDGTVCQSGDTDCTRTMNPQCQMTKILTDQDTIKQEWLYPDQPDCPNANEDRSNCPQVLVGCASDALSNSILFKNVGKQSTVDLDSLQQVVNYDWNPLTTDRVTYYLQNNSDPQGNRCFISDDADATIQMLENYVASKKTDLDPSYNVSSTAGGNGGTSTSKLNCPSGSYVVVDNTHTPPEYCFTPPANSFFNGDGNVNTDYKVTDNDFQSVLNLVGKHN